MIRLRKTLFGLLLLQSISCSLTPNCNSEQNLILGTIQAINQKNTDAYIELFDYDKILNIWRDAGEINADYKDYSVLFQNENEQIIKMHSMSYNMVISKIEKSYKIENFHFDLIDYKLINSQNEINFQSEQYKVKLKDNYNNYWYLDMYISKYNGCYLITEPIEMNYLEMVNK